MTTHPAARSPWQRLLARASPAALLRRPITMSRRDVVLPPTDRPPLGGRCRFHGTADTPVIGSAEPAGPATTAINDEWSTAALLGSPAVVSLAFGILATNEPSFPQ